MDKKEQLDSLKNEYEELIGKLSELSDDELSLVTGGQSSCPEVCPFQIGQRVKLVRSVAEEIKGTIITITDIQKIRSIYGGFTWVLHFNDPDDGRLRIVFYDQVDAI